MNIMYLGSYFIIRLKPYSSYTGIFQPHFPFLFTRSSLMSQKISTFLALNLGKHELNIGFKSCIDPGTPQNSRRIGSDFRHEKKVTFVCQPTFSMIGFDSLTCLDGAWSHKLPVCSGKGNN